ncbi:Benzoate--CoA ligase [Photorhabdus australis subsp. thailandensis]|uniref:Benzoate--CoA ligase n=1 Tax=Photorhabdus australis subsp. thailandensis TaxID=2805096 RepID=A0A1C0U3P5_9GAMM|nr:AMP-binding protein [Photorhabdus australis]OCQ52505.1 Benzoate--CoA ligase [Photorhabdus australis subsp. thailandensis]
MYKENKLINGIFVHENFLEVIQESGNTPIDGYKNVEFQCINKKKLDDEGYIDLLSRVDSNVRNGVKNYDKVFKILNEISKSYEILDCKINGDGKNKISLFISYLRQGNDKFDNFLVELDKQNKLMLVICSYLFISHKIVCLPENDNSKNIIINIPDDLTLSQAEVVQHSMEILFEIISLKRSNKLLAHVAYDRFVEDDFAYIRSEIPNKKVLACNHKQKITCFVYPNVITDIKKWDVNLMVFSENELVAIWHYLCEILSPFFLCSYNIVKTCTQVDVIVLPTFYEKLMNGGKQYSEALLNCEGKYIDKAEAFVVPPVIENILGRSELENKLKKTFSWGDSFLVIQIKEILTQISRNIQNSANRIKITALGEDRVVSYVLPLMEQYDCFDLVVGQKAYCANIVIILPGEKLWDIREFDQVSILVDMQGNVLNKYHLICQRANLLIINDVYFEIHEEDCRRAISRLSCSIIYESILLSMIIEKFFDVSNGLLLNDKIINDIETYLALKDNCNSILISQYGPVVPYEIENILYLHGVLTRPYGDGLDNYFGAIQARAALKTLKGDRINLCNFIFKPGRGIALLDPNTGEHLTYDQLNQNTKRYSQKFDALGLNIGDVVALAAVDSFQSIIIMLACFWRGLVFCPINYSVSAENIEKMLHAANPFVLICDETAQQDVNLRAFFNGLIINFHEFTSGFVGESNNITDEAVLLPEEHPAVILFTSGSTGSPRALIHEHKDFVLCNMNYTPVVVGLREGECVYTPSRIFFAYGLNGILISLFSGASHVIAAPLAKGKSYTEILKRFSVNVFFTVPMVLKMILLNEIKNNDLPNLRLCISSGEILPEALYIEAKQKMGTDIIDGIGTTEVLSTFISNRDGYSRPGSSGVLVPGFVVKLVNSDGRICNIGEVGVLWVKGNTLAKGYINDAKGENSNSFVDGWFNTRDLYFVDAEGFYYHVGRSGATLKINGCWFSPQVLEQVLMKHPQVKESAVWFSKDEFELIRPYALIVLAEEVSDLPKLWSELKEYTRSKLGKSHYPHFFCSVNALPKTSSGKLIRYALSDLAWKNG